MDIYVKTKDISKLGEGIWLWFIIQQHKNHKSREDEHKLDKLSHKNKDNYISDFQPSKVPPILSLTYKNYWILYDEDIVFNDWGYKNTY